VKIYPPLKRVTNGGNEIALTAYNIGGSNYFKPRDVSKALNIGITFDTASSSIGINTTDVYTE
jgi:hypothetical protein